MKTSAVIKKTTITRRGFEGSRPRMCGKMFAAGANKAHASRDSELKTARHQAPRWREARLPGRFESLREETKLMKVPGAELKQ